MAAWTLTSRALVGSSHTTTRGSPAKARAMATRCFSPPDSWRGLRSRWRGDEAQGVGQLGHAVVGLLALHPGELDHRALQDAAHGPVAVEGRVGVLEDHLDGPLGLRRTLGALAGDRLAVQRDLAAAVGRVDAQHGLGQRRLARARLAHQAERLAVVHAEVHADQRRDRLARLLEGLRDVVHRQHHAVLRVARRPGRGGRVGDLIEAVGVVAQAEAAPADRRRGAAVTVRHSSVGRAQRST